jgi:hypothetical protein
MKLRDIKRDVLSPLALMTAGYLLLVFPFAFFRHDDWIMVANGMAHLPRDWAFAFKPTLIMGGVEEVWFFRPFFKGILFLFYQLFHLNYFLWLAVMLLTTVAGLGFAAGALTRLRQDAVFGRMFLTLFTAGIFYHFWSLVWAGEGLMNCPQLTMLAFNLFAFVRAKEERNKASRSLWIGAALLSWTLSLGFKESGVFHVGFLLALVFSEPYFRAFSFRRKATLLAPYFLIAAVYLVFRLYFLPFNEGYVPILSANTLLIPIVVLAGSLLAPFLCLLALNRPSAAVKKFPAILMSRWLYLPFFAVTVSPYVGHPFFSPGWLLLPGFYAVFFFALIFPKEIAGPAALRRMGTALVVVSLFLVGGRLHQLGWWYWGTAQRQLLKIFSSLDVQNTKDIEIIDCANADYPDATLDRVAASSHGMYHMWEILNDKPIPVKVRPCNYRVPASEIKNTTVYIHWQFPQFKRLN